LRSGRGFVWLAVLVVWLGACGIKATPRPPLAPAPAPEVAAPDPMAEGLPDHDAPIDPPEAEEEEDEEEDLPDLLAPHDEDPFLH
jgi:hypothetical protein